MIYHRFRSFLKRILLNFRKGGLLLLPFVRKVAANGEVPLCPKRILVISQPRLGDGVLSLPFFCALREHYREAQIEILCPQSLEGLFEICSEIDHVIIDPAPRSLFALGKFLPRLREKQFDLVVDLNTAGSLFPALLARFSEARFSVGYGQDGRGVFFDATLPVPSAEAHTVERLLALLSPLEIVAPPGAVRLDLPEEKGITVPNFFPGDGADDLPLVGIHPGGNHWTQRWPVEYFAELADRLILERRARVVLCGGPGDWEMIRQVQERMRMMLEVAPPFPSLQHFARFLARLDRLICNNSGPLHLACALGTKTFSFMGPTKAVQWWPRGEGHHVFRRQDLPCIGCNRGYCENRTHDCMRGILPVKVFEVIQTMRVREPVLGASGTGEPIGG